MVLPELGNWNLQKFDHFWRAKRLLCFEELVLVKEGEGSFNNWASITKSGSEERGEGEEGR